MRDRRSPNKYRNKKIREVINGETVVFDSKAEHARYHHLFLLARAGEISGLELQPKYELNPGFKRGGKKHPAINYKADFRYVKNGVTVVEDVKGIKTAVYQMKKKLFLDKYGDCRFLEVFYKNKRFLEVEI